MEIFLIILLLYVIEIKFIMFMLCSLVFCVHFEYFYLFIFVLPHFLSLFFDEILFTLLIWLCLFIFFFFFNNFQISVFSQYKDFTVGSRSPSALSYWLCNFVTCVWGALSFKLHSYYIVCRIENSYRSRLMQCKYDKNIIKFYINLT